MVDPHLVVLLAQQVVQVEQDQQVHQVLRARQV
jgi:hypothetical protein